MTKPREISPATFDPEQLTDGELLAVRIGDKDIPLWGPGDIGPTEAYRRVEIMPQYLAEVIAMRPDMIESTVVMPGPRNTREDKEALLSLVIRALPGAQLTLWVPEIWGLATRGDQAFEGEPLTPGSIPEVWMFSRDVNLNQETISKYGIPASHYVADCLIKIPWRNRTLLLAIIGPNMTDPKILASMDRNPEVIAPRLVLMSASNSPTFKAYGDWCMWAAAGEFMRHEISVTQSHHVFARSERRRMKKQGLPEPPTVRSIALRKLTPQDKAGATVHASGHGPTHAFWVNAFWRRQWYPSLSKHKPKLIHGYLKCRDRGPLVDPTPQVRHIKR